MMQQRKKRAGWIASAVVAWLALAVACGDTDQKLTNACHGSGCGMLACSPPAPDRCADGCVNLSTDPLHCGACERACTGNTVCLDGTCRAQCGGTTPLRCGDSCVNPRTDPGHCGACDHACDEGELCSGGECRSSCGADTKTLCGRLCADLDSNSRFCGACDRACSKDQVCVAGQCTTECSGSRPLACAGQCVDPRSDPRFCGGCDVACAPGQVCNDGVCDSQCSGATPNSCDGLCVDTELNPSTCGGCAIHCRPGAVCEDGYCAASCRDASRTQCGNVCVDLATDPNHCGACATLCAPGSVCSEGSCVAECAGTTPIRCGTRCVRGIDECAALHRDPGGAGGSGGAETSPSGGGGARSGRDDMCDATLGTNQVPTLSGAESGVSRSGAFDQTYEAWQAFDGAPSMWVSALGETPAWIGYGWADAPRFITRYAIYYANGEITTRAPRNWTLQARNEGDFKVIDARVDEVGWLGHERREYDVQSPGAYREYRLVISDDNDARPNIEVISMGAFELIGKACP